MRTTYCPRCAADISHTFEPADWSVGINAGYYCDACDLGLAEHEVGEDEPMADDVQISFARDPSEQIGTPLSELASQPGTTPEQQDKHKNFKRIASSWGYD